MFRPTAAFRRKDVRDDRDPHPAGRSAVSWSLRRARYSLPSTVVFGCSSASATCATVRSAPNRSAMTSRSSSVSRASAPLRS